MNEKDINERLGAEGITKMVAAFYRKVPGDDILGKMYPSGDLEGAEQRLREFLLFRFCGDTAYTESRGRPRLRIRHAPFAIDFRARDRWLKLMNEAMVESEIGDDEREYLHRFFAQIADFLRNVPEDDGPFKI